jgi:hypothetical protein
MSEGGHVLFVWSTGGWELRDREGDPPAVGDELEVDGKQLVVTKVGPSPLPGDSRRCAYTAAA